MAYQESERKARIESLLNQLDEQRQLVLIGTAEFGPVNVPTVIYNSGQATRLFGSSGSLIEAYRLMEPLLLGVPVTFIKTSGTHGLLPLAYNHLGGELHSKGFVLKTKEAHDIYNQIQIQLEPTKIHISHPQALGGHTVTYDLNHYGVIGELANAINQDAENGKVELYAQSLIDEMTPLKESFYGCNPTFLRLTGASSGLNPTKSAYYYCLEETYGAIEGRDYQFVLPLEAYFTDVLNETSSYGETNYGDRGYMNQKDVLLTLPSGKRVSYYVQLLEFCQRQFELGIFTHGLMALHSDVIEEEDQFLLMVRESFRDNLLLATHFDHFYHVSVVASSLYYDHLSDVKNGVLAYASFLQTIGWEKPLINEPLDISLHLRQVFSSSVQKQLKELGFVSMRESVYHEGKLVIANATSLCPEPGTLSYFYNLRACQTAIAGLNQLVDDYIGYHLEELLKYNRIEKEVKYYFEQLVIKGLISDYQVAVTKVEDQPSIQIKVSLKTEQMVDYISLNGSIDLI